MGKLLVRQISVPKNNVVLTYVCTTFLVVEERKKKKIFELQKFGKFGDWNW